MTGQKLRLGQIVATPDAIRAMSESGQDAAFFLDQHCAQKWGLVDEQDWALNDQAVAEGGRVLSVYRTLKGQTIWCITEADRSSTCLLLPENY